MIFNIPHGKYSLINDFLSTAESDLLKNTLIKKVPWRQDDIRIFGKTHLQPRLTAVYGDPNVQYTYSGLTQPTHNWDSNLLAIKTKIETHCNQDFNLVLINYYRDGQDSMGWHSDDEKELGANPTIASLSLGEERYFKLRPKKNNPDAEAFNLLLKNGSLLTMQGEMQHFWQHSIAKSRKVNSPRINLTFRWVN